MPCRLSAEIRDFLLFMKRNERETRGRDSTTRRVKAAVQNFFKLPDHGAELYGSDATGMGLPICDIDLMIKAPSLESANPYAARDAKIETLHKMKEYFCALGICSAANVRDSAAVPLLEITDAVSGLEVDLSFYDEQVAQSLAEIERWKRTYGEQVIIDLVLLVKHALGMRKLGFGTAVMPYQVN